MKKTLSWKEVGQFVAVLIGVFTIIRDTLKRMAIGVEIFEWLIGEGKEFFTETLKQLGENFLKNKRIHIIDENTILVNLDAPIKLPFDGAEIKSQAGTGWVKVEKRSDGLYVDGQKVILYLSERQKNGKIKGYELREELSGKLVLHPNILDALMDNLHFIPEDWKQDENGNIRFIFFWAVIFRDPSGGFLYVRSLYFDNDQWNSYYSLLGLDWDDRHPAALRAS
ncbi:MAG: hypothetical protein A2271_04325 [Candidatus Moranbacteria bacterium RIFOXYA12_FULL_35_19]|nr:MAG: hypothetical protein UR78_C0021G0014 [Candidatus Moranbacteria bacterium GW2011_GWF2_35_39]OGI30217.1 MAG: hypothetical protein A2343_02580 [Candidatus Moranbacteria bacterium RIFOXYB12_FULL_35_8]OGI32150.1 MAG: hypothetical protein A2489_01390 [Candidatus Moranbacteria bacterium RIFOXYC12_FULL_36_13]OGI36781.1 MAG: hypothetical protein A2271_04325 [Candidatus Moranbacteria bacterium RIFOXYA12_FULL_35_19]